MHSSRMRAFCCSGCRGGVSAQGVVCPGGGVCPGHVCPGGAVCLGGVYLGGVCLGGVHHPRTEFLTDACESITFPQLLLWVVINEPLRCLVLSVEIRSERSRCPCWKAARVSTAWDPTRVTRGRGTPAGPAGTTRGT